VYWTPYMMPYFGWRVSRSQATKSRTRVSEADSRHAIGFQNGIRCTRYGSGVGLAFSASLMIRTTSGVEFIRSWGIVMM